MNKELYTIKKFVDDFEKNKIRIINDKNVYQNSHLFLYSLMCSNILKNNPYKSLILERAINIEKIFPGSSFNLLKNIFLKNTEKINKNKRRKAKFSDALDYINKQLANKDSIDLFKIILKVSGSDSLISIKNTKYKSQIKKSNSYKFDINVREDFYSILFSKSSEVKTNCYIANFDEFIEKENVIIPLLEKAYLNNKKALIIVCRGILPNIANSIKQTLLKNKMACLIYEKFTVDHDPFFFEDISLATGYSLSSESFNIKSNIENLKCFDNVILTPNSLTFTKCNKNSIDKKIKEFSSLEKNEIIEKRIKRLKGKKTEVFLSKKNQIEDIKFCISAFKKIRQFGVYFDDKDNIIPVCLYDAVEKLSLELQNDIKKCRSYYEIRKSN